MSAGLLGRLHSSQGAGTSLLRTHSSCRRLTRSLPAQAAAIRAQQQQAGGARLCRLAAASRLGRQRPAPAPRRALRVCAMAAAPAIDRGIGSGALSGGFPDSELDEFAIGVVGDLHLEPKHMGTFQAAAQQMRAALMAAPQRGARLVQLGDLGGYNHQPGSMRCFSTALDFLKGFGVPVGLVTGNHDLEGDEFETDEANLAAWTQVFEQRHYWAAELGPAICIGLSTVRFRSNRDSVHEVCVDGQQLAWLEATLQAAAGRPVVLFTHAPAMGCGVRAVEGVHVKNRCAWLNHSGEAAHFLRLVHRFPNIRLWFSGHYHLGQDYPDSISSVGGCTFVLTGVIGPCDRDGSHQSRILRGDGRGFRLSSLDHATGSERLDAAHSWADPRPPRIEWLAGPPQPWWPASLRFHQQRFLPGGDAGAAASAGEGQWFGAGADCVLRRLGSLLVEYRASFRAPVGVVCADLDDSLHIRLVDAEGRAVASAAADAQPPAEDGSRAVAVELLDGRGVLRRRMERNDEGTFFQIFQHNKWRARLARQQQARSTVAA